MKFTPTVSFVLDAVPENARQIDDLLAAAPPATLEWPSRPPAPRTPGEADPYKHDDEQDDR